jgi:hypothetical protein
LHELRIRTVIHAIEKPKQQLMEPPEGKPRLRLRTRRRHHSRALIESPLGDSPEQRRLTDSGLAPENEGTATLPQPIDHPEEAPQLPIPPQEQPSGGPYILRISTDNTHTPHPPRCRRPRPQRRDRSPQTIVRDLRPLDLAPPGQ